MTSSGPERDDDGSVDVEAAWADIVAHWDDTDVAAAGSAAPAMEGPPDVGDRVVRLPADDEDAAGPAGTQQRAAAPGRPETSEPDDEDDADDGWGVARSRVGGERAQDAADRDARVDAVLDDDSYQPPDPPPLPRGDLVSRLAWAGVLGAPVFFVLAALFWSNAPTWLIVGAVAAFVSGFVTLVVRMPDHRDSDDDGAVV